jgi:aspartyl-tRNA(Asn)/glutamyl-tRNA(Gln) amidotransferase subunit A
MTDHDVLTIAGAAHELRCGRLRSTDLVEQAFRQADAVDRVLGVYVSRFDDQALAAARNADAELAAGVDRGLLHGIPVAVKDILPTREGPTTACANVTGPYSRSGIDGPVVARLRKAGAVVTGKTTTMEIATGLPHPDMPFPLPRNPWDPSRWAGGSSSGSASGVSAGAFLGAIGTDTGGSIRTPASFCGVTGLKPTFGLVPKAACLPLSDTLDHVGPIARSARDCAIMLGWMAGHDPADPSSVHRHRVNYQARLTGSLRGMRVGIDWENHFGAPADPDLPAAFDAALNVVAGLGATLIDVSLPVFHAAGIATIVVSRAEAFSYHVGDLRRRPLDFGPGARISVSRGAIASAADYVQAQRVRRRAQRELADLFAEADLVIGPTTAFPATRLSELDVERSMSAALATSFTTYWSAVGNPALAVPIGFNRDGLPLSMQIAGRPFDDAAVLAAGDAYQCVTQWHLCPPPPLPPSAAGLPGLTRPAARPQPAAAVRARVADLLNVAGLALPDEDVDVLARTQPEFAAAIASLYAVAGARDETTAPAAVCLAGRRPMNPARRDAGQRG